jgi:hypothetical protein
MTDWQREDSCCRRVVVAAGTATDAVASELVSRRWIAARPAARSTAAASVSR